MFPPEMVSADPTRKGLSRTDLLALALILMILMVIDLPIYLTVLEGQAKRASRAVTVVHAIPIKTTSTKAVLTKDLRPDVPSLTTTSGASNRKTAP